MITANRVGYGAMQLERASIDGVAFLRHVVAKGINHIDTAQFYGPANALIREALHPYADDLMLATKVGAERDQDGGLVTAQRPEQLRTSVEANLAALGVEQVAVVNLRRADAPPGIIAEGDQRVDIDSQLAELIAMRDEGKIGEIGLSSVSAEQLTAALPAGITCVQNAHSVLDRASEPVLDVCRANEISWVPYFPLGSAFPAFPKVVEHPTVIEIARHLDVAPATVGLAWLLRHYEHTLLIPGTTSHAHLDDNLAAGDLHLDADTMARLDSLTTATAGR